MIINLNKLSIKYEVNLLYVQRNISEPIYEEELPALYGRYVHKLELHKESVSNYISKCTVVLFSKTITTNGKEQCPN